MSGPLYARYVPPQEPIQNATQSSIPIRNSKVEDSEVAGAEAREGVSTQAQASTGTISGEGRKRPSKEKVTRERKKQKIKLSEQGDVAARKHESVLSKFQKSAKISENQKRNAEERVPNSEPAEQQEPDSIDALSSFPQPPRHVDPEYRPKFSTLPSWLADPIRASPESSKSFRELGLDPKVLDTLEQSGFQNATAVQATVLPLLLPSPNAHFGDLCVSAETGSGKTLAYLLPLVESLKDSNAPASSLRGLVVVPRRDLVSQVQHVAERFLSGTSLKIGTAVGDRPIKTESSLLVHKGRRFDAATSKVLTSKVAELLDSGFHLTPELEDFTRMIPYHVPEYESKVDILVCTPGRLVEHIQSTTGFNLSSVQWLVIDEADQLLDENFQGWVTALLTGLATKSLYARESVCEKAIGSFDPPIPKRPVAKVILSASMTQNIGQLNSLKLFRPRLVTVASDTPANKDVASSTTELYILPKSLTEFAATVGDGSKKPLHMIYLLRNRILSDIAKNTSIYESNSSSSSSDDSSSSESDLSDESTQQELIRNGRTLKSPPKVLIFTNSNEDATRLHYVLTKLMPELASSIGTLTKLSGSSKGRKLLRDFASPIGSISVLVASDRASRGLDVPNITHVVNYDMPRNITNYVHRVGRTARAGRPGEGWTLFTKSEGRWFWNSIAKATEIRREDKVSRTKFDISDMAEEMKDQFEAVLEGLQGAVKKT